MDNKAKELLKKVRELILEEQGPAGVNGSSETGEIDETRLFEEFIFPSLEKNKEILAYLYDDFTKQQPGLVRKAKNKLINKIAGVARNTVEISLIKQQKFNEQILAVLKYLYERNKSLQECLNQDQNKSK